MTHRLSRHVRFLVAFLLAADPTIGVSAQEPVVRNAVRAEALGCWTLLAEHGGSALELFPSAPARFQLTNRPDSSLWAREFPSEARAIVPLDSLGRTYDVTPELRRRRLALWTADSRTDTIRVIFGNGFTGTWFAFAHPRHSSPDTLRGEADRRFDYGSPLPRVGALALRAPCR